MRHLRAVLAASLCVLGAILSGVPGAAQAERYVPAIWVDPDGCEHWVMDDGWEGYMTPHVTRDGRPVCNRTGGGTACGTMNADTLFATGSHRIGTAGAEELRRFFASTPARGFIIEGHTDSRGSDAANMRLSQQRAQAVARIARATGANVAQVRGFGERQPRAENGTASGMQQNRRVEILCVR